MISVIIPVFNRSKLLERAITSVLQGNLLPEEIIVIDDGSEEDIEKVVARFEKKVFLISQEQAGVSAARNKGILCAQGEWICLLDSDDAWHPQKLQKQWDFHQQFPELRISQTDEEWIRNGKDLKPLKKHQKPEGDIFIPSLKLCLVSPSAVMIHRSIFGDVGLFDESLPVCEDYDLWLRIAKKYPVGLLKEKLVTKYGGHSDQLSHRYFGMDRFRICAMEKHVDDVSLCYEKRKALFFELAKKSEIYAKGCLKHKKMDEANTYQKKAETYRRKSQKLV